MFGKDTRLKQTRRKPEKLFTVFSDVCFLFLVREGGDDASDDGKGADNEDDDDDLRDGTAFGHARDMVDHFLKHDDSVVDVESEAQGIEDDWNQGTEGEGREEREDGSQGADDEEGEDGRVDHVDAGRVDEIDEEADKSETEACKLRIEADAPVFE